MKILTLILLCAITLFSYESKTNEAIENNNSNLEKIAIDKLGITEYQLEDSIVCKSQYDTISNREIFIKTDKKPYFGQNPDDINIYIKANLKYPDFQMNILGRVYIRFVVEEDGTISNIEILRGIAPSLDEEAVVLIQNMPPWNAGECNGKKVPAYVVLPINFSVND